MILSQLWRRRSRALALASGILVAATSFTLLTSTVTTSQARTTGLVEDSSRSAYDILVRPPGTGADVEKERGLVEANFLSGVFGGITLGQYERIKSFAGVETAAPVANIGYLMVQSTVPVDVSAFRDSDAPAQLLRLTPTLKAGLGSYPMADQYVYLTRNPIVTYKKWNEADNTWPDLQHEIDGDKKYAVCWFYNEDKRGDTFDNLGERLPQPLFQWNRTPKTAFTPDARSQMTCVPGDGRATAQVPVAFPVLLSAIDPVAEDELVGLGSTVTSGRMLTEKDRPFWGPDSFDLDPVESRRQHDWQVPVMLSSRALTAGALKATVKQLDVDDPTGLAAKLSSPRAHDYVNGLKGTDLGTASADLGTGFRSIASADDFEAPVYWTVGPVDYRVTKDGLTARTRPAQPPGLWKTNWEDDTLGLVGYVPEENLGTQFREVTAHASTTCMNTQNCDYKDAGRGATPILNIVGRYDTDKLRGFSTLSQVPLETYRSPQVTGADAASRAALGDQPLRPDRNLGGYLSPPPTLLTTLDSLSVITHSRRKPTAQEKAPVSAIRIRVAGVTGVDPASRARVNAVAGQIRTAYPKLQVDVTVGSSPAPQTVALPRDVRVTEYWVAKGVALRILRAVDTKSAVLFGLVLVVCGLFLAQAALASVRSRRTEIGTLRCVGWSAPEILRLILGELAVIGLAAGALGALLAYGLGALLGLPTSATKAALVLPVALLLALTAGVLPAWRATRVQPLDAVTPPVTGTRRAVAVRSVIGLALRNLLRAPGRTVLGAAGLALGVAAFTVLLSLTLAFRGQVAGSLLGNAVVAQARTADYLSVALSLLLGAAGAVDVLVLSQRERAADLAVLGATGWSRRELGRLALYEGAGLALLGGLTGAVAGLATVLMIGQGLWEGRLWTMTGAALLAALAGVVLVCGVLSFPIRAMSRIAPAQLLARE
ncbi:ABC transporter permease [Streptomyces sp. NBC_01275]|uniref:FtsX-like permease family protein n=1 Tax=Streptomyces sp. NBC_01275 TaxID=2903807 RepID=UPI0022511AC6|nr:FtsX-like permease family protein [Streptomyces sp. NBC_01275]MCX4766806.1 ABC transporter permease [Streptomyces sp. NBC_01275]